MDDLAGYLEATAEEMPGYISGVALVGDAPSAWNDDGCLLMHPTRKGEVVGHRLFWDYEFTTSFARECMDASKDGENLLIQFMVKHFPKC